MQSTHAKFPRRVWIRRLLRLVGRALLRVLARPVIRGIENLPQHGPAILAGNHVAVMEIVMMVVYSKAPVEFLGTGDIPLDPKFAWLANLYGFIPIKRGSVDRAGIKSAINVLERGGLLGVFPQGGIWDTGVNETRTGTALLSILGRAPVIPIGFGGVQAALKKITRLERPLLVMNVGPALYFPASAENRRPDKELLEKHAAEILGHIIDLLPEEERIAPIPATAESFELEIYLVSKDGLVESRRDDLMNQINRAALGRLFHYPILLDALDRNLKLPVKGLRFIEIPLDVPEIQHACEAILGYLNSNPGFFTYRFGIEHGFEVQDALKELLSALDALDGNLWRVKFVPVYRYHDPILEKDLEEHGSRQVHAM